MTKFLSEPKRRRSPIPSDAFDPRFKDVLLQGRLNGYSLAFETTNDAIVFRMRAQQYRKAVHREGKEPELAKLLYQTTLRLEGSVLFVEPNDAKFAAILASIKPGGTTSEIPPSRMEGNPSDPSPIPGDDLPYPTPPEGSPVESITLEELLLNIDHIGE